jgi:glycosyltransferase involved in cell wall biosynthesis
MSLGTPVVAANSGGPKEIIDDGVTGFLFHPGDMNDLEATINRCLNREFASNVTEHAKAVVNDKFSAFRMAFSTLNVYTTIQVKKEKT